jgi:segregation and condensation protein B
MDDAPTTLAVDPMVASEPLPDSPSSPTFSIGVCRVIDPLADGEAVSPPRASGPEEGQPHLQLASATQDAAPQQVIEALLFAADAPLSPAVLAELSGVGSARRVREHVDRLNQRYEHFGLSFRVEAIAGGFQMMTLPVMRSWVARLNRKRADTRLSPAAMETLSIIAYRQPVIRADIEAIRGVACGDLIQRLRELGLVRAAGRADIVGRPMLYATTRKFLDLFGLADLDDLPPIEALPARPPTRVQATVVEAGSEAPEPPAVSDPAESRLAAGA